MYKVYPDNFDFQSYETEYINAFAVRYNKDGSLNKKDNNLNEAYKEFSKIQNWPEIHKIKSKVQKFPSKFEDLLILQPVEICEIYLEFNNLSQTEKNKINTIKFEYDVLKSRIFNFFINNIDKLNFNTCFYCYMNFINSYCIEKIDNQKTIKQTKKQFDLDHFIPKQHCKLFALCLYNFVPSCSNCNSGSKGCNFTYNCKTASELATVFPTSITYNWKDYMKFKIFPKNFNAISALLYSNNFKEFGLALESKNTLYEEESKTFEIIQKYEFFMKQFVTQIDKYRMYDNNFFNLLIKKLPIGSTSFLYEAIFNNELRNSHQLPFKKIYGDIKDIFDNTKL